MHAESDEYLMKTIFTTKRLNRTFYRQAILKYVEPHFTASQQAQLDELKLWTVKIMPVEDATGAFQGGLVGSFATGIPHGKTHSHALRRPTPEDPLCL